MGRLSSLLSILMVATGLSAILSLEPLESLHRRAQVAAQAEAPAPIAPADPTPVVEYPPKPEVVSIEPRSGDPAARMPAAHSAKTTPRPGDRASIARELQRELKRVGCYDGEVNGIWTPATRRAIKAFTERINAALPVDGPDLILLALVQDHQDKACGAACPTGQAFAADGQCVPTAILAARKVPHAARPGAPAANAAAPVITVRSSAGMIGAATPLSVDAGPMALAGPQTQNGPGRADGQPSTATPGLMGPLAPAPGVAQGAQRPADPAQRSAALAGFGQGIFRQLEKNGF
jgi:peptidoglycan hydrolase-like protein with peptidoglycan-binding domain